MAAQKMKEEKAPEPSDKDTRLWSALCYALPVLGTIIVLITDKKEDKKLLFHAWQSLFLGIVIWAAWFIGTLVTFGLLSLCFPVVYLIFLFFAYKAYQGEEIKIPTLSEMAQKQVK